MADVNVNSVKPSEASDEMVALYLLVSIAASGDEASYTFRDGIPIITGPNKEWILQNYIDCLRSITRREVRIGDR